MKFWPSLAPLRSSMDNRSIFLFAYTGRNKHLRSFIKKSREFPGSEFHFNAPVYMFIIDKADVLRGGNLVEIFLANQQFEERSLQLI